MTGGGPPWSPLGDLDLHLFADGRHDRMSERLGAHPVEHGGVAGTYFAVWAPNAEAVSVIGDFNWWQAGEHRLQPRDSTGIWEGFFPAIGPGALYKFHIRSRIGGYRVEKADPFGQLHEAPPRTASVVWDGAHAWQDGGWMARRGERPAARRPISIYEVHLGSWRRMGEDPSELPRYRDVAERLARHVASLGFTHVELMPVMEHPFYGSWGYQVTGYFAPSARYGTPDDLRYLIDVMHQHGIGVILDWVPAHFPTDLHGLGFFDGTHLYEHADPRQGFHPDWQSFIFNYDRNEVRSFLLSSARFWLDRFHADGLRVDGVASMLYLDYSRPAGEWVPNAFGGRENLGAVSLLQAVNEMVARDFPAVCTVAEESTAWPGVSRPVAEGGLGFTMKWDMGWMHDTLRYLARDPIHRRHHHDEITFRSVYALSERFVLPLSHDENVHGKGSLLGKMPGDAWQRLANLRLLYGYMFATPGKKLLFMGNEIGQEREWGHDRELDWGALARPEHRGVLRLIAALNGAYRDRVAMHDQDFEPAGFEWIDGSDAERSLLAFARWARDGESHVVVVANFTPVVRDNYRVGVFRRGRWREVVNTDAAEFGGSGVRNDPDLEATPLPWQNRPFSLCLTLPPLAVLWLEAAGPR